MPAKTLTISMPEHQLAWLEEHKNTISPSDVFQNAVENLINQYKISEKDIQQMRAKADRLQENLLCATEFIREQKLWEKFVEKYGDQLKIR